MISEASTTAVMTSKFVVDDDKLAESGMNKSFKSWVDMCDNEESAPPKHGAPTVNR